MSVEKRYKLKPRPVPEKIYYDLDEEQKNAVLNSDGRSIVIAGPGSGKTRVVTYKIVHLISQGVSPSKILLMTFTRAAAKEMIDRAKMVTGRDLKEMVAGTFHSVCNYFLKKYAIHLGYRNDYTILDRHDSAVLMGHARTKVLERLPKEFKKKVPKKEVLLSIYSYMMNILSSLETAVKKKNPMFYDISDVIGEIFGEYSIEKRNQNVMDYDDLLVNFLRLLQENSKIRRNLSERFKWILVDEFQDTNIVQYMIVEHLSEVHGNVFVVGDDAQSIYSFRGARFENVNDFINGGDTKVFRIQTNYRSTESIVELINHLIPTGAVPKKLKAVRGKGKKPVLVKTFDEEEQANFVGQRIEELVDEGFNYGDIAILYRSHYSSIRLEMELSVRGIPYKVLSGLRFTELAHIKDILAFLKVVQNPRDVVSWVRVAKLFDGVGDKTASKLAEIAVRYSDTGLDPFSAIDSVGSSRKTSLSTLKHIFENITNLSRPSDMIREILGVFYEEYLFMRYEDARDRKNDVLKLADLAARYENVDRFLSDLLTTEDFATEEYVDSDKVTLTTVHQAKGLEWKVVFVVSVNPGDFPSGMALMDGNLEEEERLFYVAITRAKDLLYIIYQALGTERPYVGNFIKFARGVDFVEKIPKELVEVWEIC